MAEGLTIEGERVPLLGPQGIFKPRVLETIPLSITTSPKSPYDDSFSEDGLLCYRYRGTDPRHPENGGLREAMRRRIPLVYFHGVVPGKYLAAWPVYIVHDDPDRLAVKVAVDDADHLDLRTRILGTTAIPPMSEEADSARRAYITAAVKVRLHQRSFRERVLDAYQRQCAFCRFKHEEMLDAAHIIPDSDPSGDPLVKNGLALCTLHHRAFDKQFLGLRPDYVIQVRPDILEEHDGPTLAYAIQALHGQPIVLPHQRGLRPDPGLVTRRYESFQAAFR